jgi:hypothetical protein
MPSCRPIAQASQIGTLSGKSTRRHYDQDLDIEQEEGASSTAGLPGAGWCPQQRVVRVYGQFLQGGNGERHVRTSQPCCSSGLTCQAMAPKAPPPT